jgi:hypothetical protein
MFRKHLDFSVQIFGNERKAKAMSSIKDTKLKVTCRIIAEPTDETTTDGEKALPGEGDPKLLVCHTPAKDSENQYFFGTNKHSYEHRASAFIKDWTTAGRYTVTFEVTDATQKVYQVEAPTVTIVLKSGPAAAAFVEKSEAWQSKKKQVQLGKENPDTITFYLEDAHGNVIAVPPTMPEIVFKVKAELPYKSKKKDKDAGKEKLTQEKTPDLENLFTMFCTPERHSSDSFCLVLRNIIVDCKGNYHPKQSGRLHPDGPDNPKFKERRAKKVLGDMHSDNRYWRKVSFTVTFNFPDRCVESEKLHAVVMPGEPAGVTLGNLSSGIFDENNTVCVKNGDKLPQFDVQLVDHVGIPAYPASRDAVICKISRSDDEPSIFAEDSDLEVPCTAKGAAAFKRVITHVTDPKQFNQALDLDIIFSGGKFADGLGLHALGLLSVKVAPSDRYAALCVPPQATSACCSIVRLLVGHRGLKSWCPMMASFVRSEVKMVWWSTSSKLE